MRSVAVNRGDDTVNAPDSNILAALSVTAGLSFAMVWLAARMSMLELRRPVRCPACGRLRRAGTCRCNG
jgi:hypothetical protein